MYLNSWMVLFRVKDNQTQTTYDSKSVLYCSCIWALHTCRAYIHEKLYFRVPQIVRLVIWAGMIF